MALSAEEQELVSRDDNLIGLAEVLDEDAMLSKFRQSFPELNILAANRTYIRYKPDTNCLVKYSITHSEGQADAYAKVFSRRDPDKLNKAILKQTRQSDPDALKHVFIEKGLLTYRYPIDGKSPYLHRLQEPEFRDRLMRKMLPDHLHFEGCKLERLQYKPERRFVGKVSAPNGEHAIIKLYAENRFELAEMAGQDNAADLVLAKMIGKSEKYNSLAFEWIDGTLLAKQLLIPGDMPVADFHETGRMLAMFHENSAVTVHRRTDTGEFARSLFDLSHGLDRLVSQFSARARSLADALAGALTSLSGPLTRVHGDFYAEQVLKTETGIRFIDLDDISNWFPAYDIGLFIAHLERYSLRGTLSEEQAGQLEEAFLKGYLDQRNCDLRQIQLFTAVGLMQLAHHPFRNCDPDWTTAIERLLHRCEKRLTGKVALGNNYRSHLSDEQGNQQ